jgi:hypothetical protein
VFRPQVSDRGGLFHLAGSNLQAQVSYTVTVCFHLFGTVRYQYLYFPYKKAIFVMTECTLGTSDFDKIS